GWCCLDGKIYPVSEGCCEEFGGRFFRTREEAEEFCANGQGELKIRDLKSPDWAKYVGQTVAIEGIFVRDPLPMLVTDHARSSERRGLGLRRATVEHSIQQGGAWADSVRQCPSLR
ncbi:MAG: hypothetical protein P8Z74_13430, partial [Acidobacteriota bacterium]